QHAGQQFDPDVVAAFLRIPSADWEELRTRSLQQSELGVRANALTELHAFAAAASSTSSSSGKLSTPLVSKTNRLVHRPSQMRTLRRRQRHL
ncbi:MAG: hypothetical protein LC747_04405, partial [Acidobacteria bacterium]|nr:hypothetical protein [Acidobacteriota bacterium]